MIVCSRNLHSVPIRDADIRSYPSDVGGIEYIGVLWENASHFQGIVSNCCLKYCTS